MVGRNLEGRGCFSQVLPGGKQGNPYFFKLPTLWMLESVITWGSKTQGFVSELPSYTPILVGQKSSCRRGSCALGHPWAERARVGRGGSVGGAGSCAEVQGQARAMVARVVLPGPTTEPPPPGLGHARPAGPRGGAGRQLDPAAIYGPFRRAGASSGRSLSRAPHNGAAAAVEPPPPRLEACTGAAAGPGRFRSPESVHPSFHSCSLPPVLPSIHSSVLHPSTHPPIHPIPPRTHPPPLVHPCILPAPLLPPPHSGPAFPASQPACRLARLDYGDPAPRRCARGCCGAPLLLRRQAPGSPPGWHGQRRRVRVEHTGAHSSGLRATICQIRVDAAVPRSFRRRTSRNSEQSQLCSCLLWMRTGREKKSFNAKR